MARYIGPKSKIARRFKEQIFGKDKVVEKKNYPPGQHGNARKKISEYGLQLMEKQKVKYTYGLLERQFARFFNEAAKRKGVTGQILLQLLESRLDNVVYRLGIAHTRDGARQLITHKHVMVNGVVSNIPSLMLKQTDEIEVREKSKNLVVITESLADRTTSKYDWLEWDASKMKGKFLNYPERESIPENINEQLIVELYSK